jgi:hypothetical protein
MILIHGIAAGSYSLRKDLAEEWDACAGYRAAGGTMGRDARGLDKFVDQVAAEM